ncbi:hypothetical protein GPA10_12310 [Streptomyces sp. p1417]|uniref:Uncharacterized protein n=1 Tax=Streptomyces typhae TaxID=2681492 RepID=A0A6L6WTX0_9ACTN|nr:hypothetical protein [Streptomyces typhae]MVO85513.1 hypothetical protein [Streptomyces typhae]
MALVTRSLPAADCRALLAFLADRIAELPPAQEEPLIAGVNAQLGVYGALLRHLSHGEVGARDAGFLDGIGLALRHVAVRWNGHPDFKEHWSPPRVPVEELLEHGDGAQHRASGRISGTSVPQRPSSGDRPGP